MNVLVLCTGNSARSILGEVLINELGGDKFRAYSAGSCPVGKVNPGALRKLRQEHHSVDGLASKSWDIFSGADAPIIGAPITVHWGIPDPATDGDFDAAYLRLRRRVEAMVALPVRDMTRAELLAELQRIHG
jgi:arsenate reductase